MGRASLQAMIEHQPLDDLDLSLGWHIKSNLFPPVDAVWKDTLRQAIDNVADAFGDALVMMPDGEPVQAFQLVERFRLWEFVEATQKAWDQGVDPWRSTE